jgi:hypothetical protein
MLGKNVITGLIFTGFILILISSCQKDEQYVEFEKERILYQEKVQSAVDRLDMKIGQLHAIVEQEHIDQHDLEPYIADMEGLEESLNRKLGELDNVSVSDWKETKGQIDSLLKEMNENMEKVGKILQTSKLK